MTPEALEYERAAKASSPASGKDERDAARKRWDAAKAEMDKAISERRDAYDDGYLAALAAEPPALDVAYLTGLYERLWDRDGRPAGWPPNLMQRIARLAREEEGS